MNNPITTKMYVAKILSELYNNVEERVKSINTVYAPTGEKEQKRNWRTDDLMFEDEDKTIPVMQDKYDYIPRDLSTLSDEDKCELEACDIVKKALVKLA